MNTDKEVAEKILGYKSIKRQAVGFMSGVMEHLYEDKEGALIPVGNFTPKTNIDHAMEVEAEMFNRGYSIELRHGQNERDRRYECYAVFLKAGHRYYAFGATLGEAICLAALRAVR